MDLNQQHGQGPQSRDPQMGQNQGQYGQGPRGLPQGASFKGDLQQQTGGDQGRNTPPPMKGREDLAGLDVAALLQRHDELRMQSSLISLYSS